MEAAVPKSEEPSPGTQPRWPAYSRHSASETVEKRVYMPLVCDVPSARTDWDTCDGQFYMTPCLDKGIPRNLSKHVDVDVGWFQSLAGESGWARWGRCTLSVGEHHPVSRGPSRRTNTEGKMVSPCPHRAGTCPPPAWAPERLACPSPASQAFIL